jgi:leader peptidase (prepilin peptidase)/N-methyltransferase
VPAARRSLGRLRRGARVQPPWCELGVALAWGAVGAAVGVGVVPALWLPALLGLGWLAVPPVRWTFGTTACRMR